MTLREFSLLQASKRRQLPLSASNMPQLEPARPGALIDLGSWRKPGRAGAGRCVTHLAAVNVVAGTTTNSSASGDFRVTKSVDHVDEHIYRALTEANVIGCELRTAWPVRRTGLKLSQALIRGGRSYVNVRTAVIGAGGIPPSGWKTTATATTAAGCTRLEGAADRCDGAREGRAVGGRILPLLLTPIPVRPPAFARRGASSRPANTLRSSPRASARGSDSPARSPDAPAPPTPSRHRAPPVA